MMSIVFVWLLSIFFSVEVSVGIRSTYYRINAREDFLFAALCLLGVSFIVFYLFKKIRYRLKK